MTKYYVESGSVLQVVVQARSALDAILKAFQRASSQKPLRLADRIIVNQRGFVWERENHELRGDEVIFPTRLILGPPLNRE